MPFADLRGGVLQHAGDKADLAPALHGQESRSRAPEVMKPMAFPNFARTRARTMSYMRPAR